VERERSRIVQVRVLSLRGDGGAEEGSASVPVEAALALEVNGRVVAHLMRLPGHDAELALGFCLSEGYLGGLGDVLSVEVCAAEEGCVRVRLSREVAERPVRVLSSACVEAREEGAHLPQALPVGGLCVTAQTLLGLPRKLREAQEVRQTAGAVHAAALFDAEGEMVVVREDVGRHNAVDKVLGYGVYHGVRFGRMALVTSGRASSEMVLKAAAAGVPVAASLSGPTSLGVELAEQLGVTLIGYLRTGRMTLYAHAERVGD
jgi:FdhD protein